MTEERKPDEIKTELFEVKLFVKGEEVASSKDILLWQGVLNAISEGAGKVSRKSGIELIRAKSHDLSLTEEVKGKGDLFAFSKAIGITNDEIEAACGPTRESPYLHLDEQYWESLKRNTPRRGQGSISSSVLGATLLTLWFKYADLGFPSLDDVTNVEKTIGLEDKNIRRSIRKCKWLQIRNDKISINPVEISKAIAVCKAYSTKKPLELIDN